jgi:hypothetical protein
MIVAQRRKLIMFCALLSCLGISSSASSRVWNATPLQIAADYSSIFHNKGNNDLVSITWFATPMMPAGSQLYPILEKYILIGIVHSRANPNQPPAGMTFDEIKTLDARDERGNLLTATSESELTPASVGLLATYEAAYRRGLGPRGNGVRFFLFDAGTIRACEKGGISVLFEGEAYTWETPFPGCSQ